MIESVSNKTMYDVIVANDIQKFTHCVYENIDAIFILDEVPAFLANGNIHSSLLSVDGPHVVYDEYFSNNVLLFRRIYAEFDILLTEEIVANWLKHDINGKSPLTAICAINGFWRLAPTWLMR